MFVVVTLKPVIYLTIYCNNVKHEANKLQTPTNQSSLDAKFYPKIWKTMNTFTKGLVVNP